MILAQIGFEMTDDRAVTAINACATILSVMIINSALVSIIDDKH